MKFIDYVEITVRSGKGGAGSAHFRREKYEPRGGPDGGDGGKGGSVILEADPHLYTLMDLRYNKHHFADSGEPGGGQTRTGADGEDIVLHVPPGTVARDEGTGEPLGEVVAPGERLVLAPGGRGGKGNTFFKSATNRAPRHAQPGEAGQERQVILELKLLADVGLVGFPNAGKSTLVASLSAATPKQAGYPFTTLEPSLGMVYVGESASFVMADLPGIIEGASEGRGLGLRFLRHIERNAVLLFVIPITSKDLAAEYEMLLGELRAFSPALLEKPRLIALSKIDLLPEAERSLLPEIAEEEFERDVEIVPISAVAQMNLDHLKRRLWERVSEAMKAADPLTRET